VERGSELGLVLPIHKWPELLLLGRATDYVHLIVPEGTHSSTKVDCFDDQLKSEFKVDESVDRHDSTTSEDRSYGPASVEHIHRCGTSMTSLVTEQSTVRLQNQIFW
jgi:hypothetical protein